MTLLLLNYLGIFVFAISGALVAGRKQMDIFGFVVLALMPAIGGGTLRDLILDVPVFWIVDHNYLYLTLAAALLTFLIYRPLERVSRALSWFDAVGLSVFCVLGTAKALTITGSATIAVMMGVVTAVAGGIVRDTVANDVPLVLRHEVYATAAFIGAVAFVALQALAVPFAQWLAIAAALAVRTLGIVKGLSLPRAA
ncbi:MAG: trimeric intracellular cation channel family protein [Pseudomonadales bacterium]